MKHGHILGGWEKEGQGEKPMDWVLPYNLSSLSLKTILQVKTRYCSTHFSEKRILRQKELWPRSYVPRDRHG